MKPTNIKSIRKVWDDKDIYWINSYATIIKYISKDYPHIFKPIMKGDKSGKRYWVKEENIQKFIKMFESNQLA